MAFSRSAQMRTRCSTPASWAPCDQERRSSSRRIPTFNPSGLEQVVQALLSAAQQARYGAGTPMTRLITLFHGTTWTRAKRILEEGWQPQDVFGIVEDVAAQFGAEASVLLEDMRKYGGYLIWEQG